MDFQRLCRTRRDILANDLSGPEFDDSVIVPVGTVGTVVSYNGDPALPPVSITVWYFGAVSWIIPIGLLEPVIFEESR